MAVLKHDDDHAGSPASRRFAWFALLPVIAVLLLVGFIIRVGYSRQPVTVGRLQFIGPHCTRSTMYVWTRGTVVGVSLFAYNPISPTPIIPVGSSVLLTRGALMTPPGLQAWVWMNRGGAGRPVALRQVWQGCGFTVLEEVP